MKRLDQYTESDFDVLSSIVAAFGGRLLTTPNILTEVTNRTDWFEPGIRAAVHRALATALGSWLEVYVPSVETRNDAAFERLGLTDCVTAAAAARRPTPRVVTVDLDLYLTLLHRGVDCVNFNHLRHLGPR